MNSINKNPIFKVTRILRNNEFVLFIILVVMSLIISSFAPTFLSLENLFDILKSSSFVGICAIGFLVVLISGGIDISFTATATITQFLVGTLLINTHVPAVVAILLSMCVGALLGGLNALIINKLKAPAIIVTIATLNIYYGFIQFVSQGRWLYGFPNWFRATSRILVLKLKNADGNVYGISIFTLIWIILALFGIFLLHKTVLGRKIYAIGGNPDAAHRAGVKVNKVRIFCYAFLGTVAAIASIVHAMITQTIAPNAIIALNFDVLAAVVIGGANIFGGIGTMTGTILGVLLVAMLKNGLTLMQIPTYWHQVLIGGILLASVAITTYRTNKNLKHGVIDVT